MNPKNFPEVNTVIAKNQPEYRPIPAHVSSYFVVTFCWKLSFRERLAVLFNGELWHQVRTFDRPLQPQKLTVEKPI